TSQHCSRPMRGGGQKSRARAIFVDEPPFRHEFDGDTGGGELVRHGMLFGKADHRERSSTVTEDLAEIQKERRNPTHPPPAGDGKQRYFLACRRFKHHSMIGNLTVEDNSRNAFLE